MRSAICLFLLSSIIPAVNAQAPSGGRRMVTVVLAGPALSSGAAQEALLLAVPWVDFGDQLYSRQNVQVVMDFWWGGGKTTRIIDDARARRADYDRARFLLSNAGYFSRGTTLVLLTDLNNPDLKRATYWLRDQLQRLDIRVDANIRHGSRANLDAEGAAAMLGVWTP
jgi:hypothetical protein